MISALIGFIFATASPQKTARLALRGYLNQAHVNYSEIPNKVLDEIADLAWKTSESLSEIDKSKTKAEHLNDFIEFNANQLIDIQSLDEQNVYEKERLIKSNVYKILLENKLIPKK